jgi:23S rRNA pseudouridine2605 synthase
MIMRLQKYLAQSGLASRRQSEALIAEGRVTVNGEVAVLGQVVNPEVDVVCVDGTPVQAPAREHVYVVLNKPAGVLTTAKDTHGRPTVFDCLKGLDVRVFPVGRLDQDAEGVLLLTNDGDLAHRLMHPRYEVAKTYLVWVRGAVTPDTLRRLERGLMLEDGFCKPDRVQLMNAGLHLSLLRLTLHEGRKREIKRLCRAVGHPVQRLCRVRFANIDARGLAPGRWRFLTPAEVANLRRLTTLTPERQD